MSKRKHEPTQPGNPQKLTINQHIHSKSCIKRFTNSAGLVGILERSKVKPSSPIGPAAAIFCAKRVWSEHLEHGVLLAKIEADFLTEVETCISAGTVTSHKAITEYLSMWQIRAQLNAEPPPDVVLRGISGSDLTRDQEELLEKRGYVFARTGGVVPGRNTSYMMALRQHDITMTSLGELSWGVIRAVGPTRFICPDRPDGQAYIPITPGLALVAGLQDEAAADATVRQWNREAYEHCARLVFGHPDDIDVFAAQDLEK